MKLVLLLLSAALVLDQASAWGGLFNRFNPSMLSNLGGYGAQGSYGRELYGVANEKASRNRHHSPNLVEEVIAETDEGNTDVEDSEEEEDDPCMGKRCTANEHCCDGHVCVDTEDEANDVSYGTCLPIFGKKQGERCFRDNDCESGFLCIRDADGEKSCQAPVEGTQTLGEDCRTSSDCNISRGLCCKLQRRARSQPKKICAYFTSPQVCIGPVASNPMAHRMEHTAGEKRMSGHPDYHHFK